MQRVPTDLIRRYDISGPRYTSYPTVPAWSSQFGEAAYREALRELDADDAPVAIYVHMPYCAAKCFYCGCNAFTTSRSEVIDRYLTDLERELDMVIETTGTGRRAAQMHWGGGTPNLLSDAQLARAYGMFERRFSFTDDAELSIEADPRLSSRPQLSFLKALGFNRISFGVQDLDPSVQEAIGRVQSETLVRDVCDGARAAGFKELNLDLIYGLPRQTTGSFSRTINSVLSLEPDRIACFGYAHMPMARPHQNLIDEHDLPVGEARFALFSLAASTLGDAGYAWIGLDHFARSGDPLAVAQREGTLHRNFMGYTTMPGQHLLGFGASSISEVAGRFAQNDAKIGGWREAIDQNRLPTVRGHVMTSEDKQRGDAIRHLMCNLELPFALAAGALRPSLDRLRSYAEDGLVAFDSDCMHVTDLGRFFLRNLCMELDAYLPSQAADKFSRTV